MKDYSTEADGVVIQDSVKWPMTLFCSSRKQNRIIALKLKELRKQAKVGLHLGCGNNKLPGMINCDLIHPSADKHFDATDLSEFTDASVDLIESHHMIEHLTFQQADLALLEWSRVLKKGGRVIITCPDLTRVCILWLLYSLLDIFISQKEKLDYILRMISGPQNYEGMVHQSHYSKRHLIRLLPVYGLQVEFSCSGFPKRPTPSLLVVAGKR